MMAMVQFLKARLANKKGQGMVEYGLIVGIIAVVAVLALTVLRQPIIDLFTRIATYINGQPV